MNSVLNLQTHSNTVDSKIIINQYIELFENLINKFKNIESK